MLVYLAMQLRIILITIADCLKLGDPSCVGITHECTGNIGYRFFSWGKKRRSKIMAIIYGT